MKTAILPTIGGAGATSLALTLAYELAGRGRAVTLVDADPSAELSARTGSRTPAPLADLFSWSEAEAAAAKPAKLEGDVAIVPADHGRYVGAGIALGPATLAACVRAQGARGPVLVDLPPVGSPATSAALSVLESVIGVVPATAAGLRSLAPFLRLLLGARTRPGGPPALVGIVVTHTREGEASEAIGTELAGTVGRLVRSVIVPWDPSLEISALRTERAWSTSAATRAAIAPLVDLLGEELPSTNARRANGAAAAPVQIRP